MRNFSEYEKDIMRKLIKSKSGIPSLLSQDFIKNARLLVSYLPSGDIKYEFRSDTYDFAAAIDEFAKLVHLLRYLLNENLIRIIHPVATSLNIFTVHEQWSIGDSTSTNSQIKLLNQGETVVPNFFRDHRDNSFEATQDLKSLAKLGFMNLEQVKHRQIIRVTVIGVVITFFGSIIVPMLVSYWQYKKNYDELNNRIENLNKGIEVAERDNKIDSIRILKCETDLTKLKEKVDSIKRAMKPKPNRLASRKNVDSKKK